MKKELTNIIVHIGGISEDILKYSIRKYGFVELGDGLELHSEKDDNKILRVTYPNGNFRNVVKNHSVTNRCNWKYITEQVRQIMTTHYNVPDPKYFPTFQDWVDNLNEYGFCNSKKRMDKELKELGFVSVL